MTSDDIHAVGLLGSLDSGENIADVDTERDTIHWRLNEARDGDRDVGPLARIRSEPPHLARDPISCSTNPTFGICLRGEGMSGPERHELIDDGFDAFRVDLSENRAKLCWGCLSGESGPGPGWPGIGGEALGVAGTGYEWWELEDAEPVGEVRKSEEKKEGASEGSYEESAHNDLQTNSGALPSHEGSQHLGNPELLYTSHMRDPEPMSFTGLNVIPGTERIRRLKRSSEYTQAIGSHF